ncbi:MAG: hypothetical protein JJLCMIEE_01330 [Acidimicrobiales bacterium]|nr:MAG: DNA-3-methyladenine glycosylase 2 family protein [Actinomycetota bacterium]MBV6508270.1 hypothetical protein [Acidimicrobiales bacterium]RIK07340.1 MAG: DNA-3-methyladenine glycosylase [Acidobacteriota bacterium]
MTRARVLTTGNRLDLRATMAKTGKGRNDPTLRFARDGVWRATVTPEGSSTVRVQHGGGMKLLVDAWGPGSDWTLDRAEDLLGLNDDRSGFRADRHPLVARLDRDNPGLRIARTNGVWHALLPVLLSQKVTSAQAKRAYYGILHRYGAPAPGPADLLSPPGPERLADLGYHDLHSLGVERRRAELVLRTARRSQQLEALAEIDTELALKRLLALPGIGAWSVGRVSFVAFGDADAVAVGDYHLADDVCWGLAGEARGSDERMLELLGPFAGHRGRVIRLLSLGGIHAPKRGPRLAPMRIEQI